MRKVSETAASLGYFNLARGLGMVLILLGHSITPFFPEYESTHTLFAGAGSVLGGGIMTMFFMISGFGFYSRSPKKCLATQYKLLLKPYIITATAILLTRLVLALLKQRPFADHGGELVLTYLLCLNAEGGGQIGKIPIESVSIFWFILALFGGWVIFNSIFRLKSKKQQTILIGTCVTVGYLLTLVSQIWPFCLPMMLLSVGYLAAGYGMRQRLLLERRLPGWCWTLLLTTACLSAAFGRVNMVACQWKLGLLDVAGSFCTGFLLMRLYCGFMQKHIQGPIIRLLEAVGFRSIWIVFLHGYEKVIFPWYRLEELLPNSLAAAVCFAGRCAVIFILFRFLNLAGRKRRRKPAIIIES